MHDPVTAILPMKLPIKTTNKARTTPLPMKPCWDKVDKDVYESTTETNLKALADHIEGMPPTIIADRLNVILTKCAESALPPTKQRRKRTSKHKWLRSFKPYAQAVNKTYRALMLLDPKDRKTSTQYHQHKAAKHMLRQIQRQAAARQRQEEQAAIIHSCENNNRENFYKLIKQKPRAPRLTSVIDFQEHTKETGEPDSWASYFKDLATPKKDNNYDEAYRNHLQITHLLQCLNNQQETTTITVTKDDVHKHITSLKNKKAADIHGITSEHLKYASPQLVQILTYLSNQIIASGKLPASFKQGIITPVLKNGKPAKQPNSYRRITITSIVGKIIEKHLLQNIRSKLDPVQCCSQFGFTKGNSPTCAALIITELMAEANDTKRELHITFIWTPRRPLM